MSEKVGLFHIKARILRTLTKVRLSRTEFVTLYYPVMETGSVGIFCDKLLTLVTRDWRETSSDRSRGLPSRAAAGASAAAQGAPRHHHVGGDRSTKAARPADHHRLMGGEGYSIGKDEHEGSE